jgi:hypothetical protein
MTDTAGKISSIVRVPRMLQPAILECLVHTVAAWPQMQGGGLQATRLRADLDLQPVMRLSDCSVHNSLLHASHGREEGAHVSSWSACYTCIAHSLQPGHDAHALQAREAQVSSSPSVCAVRIW